MKFLDSTALSSEIPIDLLNLLSNLLEESGITPSTISSLTAPKYNCSSPVN